MESLLVVKLIRNLTVGTSKRFNFLLNELMIKSPLGPKYGSLRKILTQSSSFLPLGSVPLLEIFLSNLLTNTSRVCLG